MSSNYIYPLHLPTTPSNYIFTYFPRVEEAHVLAESPQAAQLCSITCLQDSPRAPLMNQSI
jgi:hypothetical protein